MKTRHDTRPLHRVATRQCCSMDFLKLTWLNRGAPKELSFPGLLGTKRSGDIKLRSPAPKKSTVGCKTQERQLSPEVPSTSPPSLRTRGADSTGGEAAPPCTCSPTVPGLQRGWHTALKGDEELEFPALGGGESTSGRADGRRRRHRSPSLTLA